MKTGIVMATLFRGQVEGWNIAEMDLAAARGELRRRVVRLASVWGLAGLITAVMCLAGLEAAHAASSGAALPVGRGLLAGALSIGLALSAGLTAWLVRRSLSRSSNRR
jgi:hypothetical protein